MKAKKICVMVLISLLLLTTGCSVSQEASQSSTSDTQPSSKIISPTDEPLIGYWTLVNIMENGELIDGENMSTIMITEDHRGTIKLYDDLSKTNYTSYDFTWEYETSTSNGIIYSTDINIDLGVYTKDSNVYSIYDNNVLVVHIPDHDNSGYFYLKDIN